MSTVHIIYINQLHLFYMKWNISCIKFIAMFLYLHSLQLQTKVSGMDFSESAVEKAKENYPQYDFFQKDIFSFPIHQKPIIPIFFRIDFTHSVNPFPFINFTRYGNPLPFDGR